MINKPHRITTYGKKGQVVEVLAFELMEDAVTKFAEMRNIMDLIKKAHGTQHITELSKITLTTLHSEFDPN